MISNKLYKILRCRPTAVALIKGSEKYPTVKGNALFYDCFDSVYVCAQITGLPKSNMNAVNRYLPFIFIAGLSARVIKPMPFQIQVGILIP